MSLIKRIQVLWRLFTITITDAISTYQYFDADMYKLASLPDCQFVGICSEFWAIRYQMLLNVK